MPREPLTLHLPCWMLDSRRFNLHKLLAAEDDRTASDAWELMERFAMARHELRFAVELIERKRNLWLYRCNQRRFCGDFVVLDMASAAVHLRPAYALELKTEEPLKIGVKAGIQLRNLETAVGELIEQGVLTPESPVTRVMGGGDVVLKWLSLPMKQRIEEE